MKSNLTRIAKILTAHYQTLGLAESCTGGQIAASFTAKSGASKFFNGAIVSYANSAKRDLLGVRETQLKKHGAVSKEVALAMARGARRALKVDWAVSVTGIAGPTGGTKNKPVGLVFYAVVGPHFAKVENRIISGTRKRIQKEAAENSVLLLTNSLITYFQKETKWLKHNQEKEKKR
jgi:PncC family amidohydrolase